MAFFPLFIDLTGRKCLVVGAGKVASRKIERLLSFNATVIVVAPEADQSILYWTEQGLLTYLPREYSSADLAGVFLVIAATADRAVNETVDREASALGVWVNVADHSGQGNFHFPAVIQRDQLVVGISTAGSFPALSRQLRLQLEKELDVRWGAVLDELGTIRSRLQQEVPDPQNRRAILRRLAKQALAKFTVEISESD
jgi:precorrin-2 dehydrogenase/sirohydrochlorin ferrochelatase